MDIVSATPWWLTGATNWYIGFADACFIHRFLLLIFIVYTTIFFQSWKIGLSVSTYIIYFVWKYWTKKKLKLFGIEKNCGMICQKIYNRVFEGSSSLTTPQGVLLVAFYQHHPLAQSSFIATTYCQKNDSQKSPTNLYTHKKSFSFLFFNTYILTFLALMPSSSNASFNQRI